MLFRKHLWPKMCLLMSKNLTCFDFFHEMVVLQPIMCFLYVLFMIVRIVCGQYYISVVFKHRHWYLACKSRFFGTISIANFALIVFWGRFTIKLSHGIARYISHANDNTQNVHRILKVCSLCQYFNFWQYGHLNMRYWHHKNL